MAIINQFPAGGSGSEQEIMIPFSTELVEGSKYFSFYLYIAASSGAAVWHLRKSGTSSNVLSCRLSKGTDFVVGDKLKIKMTANFKFTTGSSGTKCFLAGDASSATASSWNGNYSITGQTINKGDTFFLEITQTGSNTVDYVLTDQSGNVLTSKANATSSYFNLWSLEGIQRAA